MDVNEAMLADRPARARKPDWLRVRAPGGGGFAETMALMDKFNAVSARFGEELTDEEKAQILAMREEGKNVNIIARELHISNRIISEFVKNN